MAWDTDWAWVGGFLEGEGCFAITITPRNGIRFYSQCISVSQRKKAPLVKLQRIAGGRLSQDSRGVWRWQTTSPILMREILPLIIPHLVEKQSQAKLLLKFCNSRKGKRGKYLSPSKKTAQTKMYARMREMKL